MQWARFLLYATGFTLSVAMALQFWRLRRPLGKVLAALLLAQAAQCAILAFLLVEVRWLGMNQECELYLLTASAALLAAGPFGLWLWFMRQNGR